jgi:TetR/AcrR family transcriptional regulator, transcriptional repressor for nem operon
MSIKESIIHEALKLFSLKGFSSTSITDILEATGASKGGFYNHFKSKEDLFFAVLEHARQIWREKVLTDLDRVSQPLEKICKLLENYRDLYLMDSEDIPGGCIFINLAVELADKYPHLADAVNQGFSGFKTMVNNFFNNAKKQGLLRGDTSTEAMTEMVFASMLGASMMYSVDKSTENLQRTIGAIIQYLRT